MYSLYRAWLSMSQPPAELPATSLPLNLSAPIPIFSSGSNTNANTNTPDVQLQVGPSLTNFSAHRNVLAAHSGFFKAALNNFTANTTTVGPILVPNIAVDEFSSLLTFMYTGYLDLNLGNIYNILLATHILHMPRALELCRNFLMQQQQQQQQQLECHPIASTSTSTSTSIIKPIASRKPLPNIEALTTPLLSTITDNTELLTAKDRDKDSVFKIYHSAEKPSQDVIPEDNKPSTSTNDKKPDQKSEKLPKKDKKRRGSSLIAQPACSLSDDRIIVDIACCDGPVRFHRVVNKNYGRKTHLLPNNTNTAVVDDKKRNTLAAINKIMTENINKLANTPPTPTTTSKDTDNDDGENATSSQQSSTADLYTCLYCNHTFKSQYCYQKHARRHLNPVDAVKTQTPPAEGEKAVNVSTKREFKLLDMNVQYYPCKTCGSKFPSYYFVHKHRKLCHADEMADGTNKNNEIVQVKPKMKKTAQRSVNISNNMDVDDVDENSGELVAGGDVNAQEDTTGSDIIDVEETN